ncbi:MAG: hypothetical protein ACI8ZM_002183 [Crocinitomix sp.]|jgi:hypothetical protein
MLKVIALTAANSDHEYVIESAIKMATFFEVQIQFLHFVPGPSDWGHLSRTNRDNYPACKVENANARDKFDSLLREVRNVGLKASKRIVIEEVLENVELDAGEHDLILIDAKSFWKLNTLKWLNSSSLILLQTVFNPSQMNDLVVNSCFQVGLKKMTLDLILKFSDRLNLYKHLLFINTQENFESTKSSVERMKKSINQTGINKTRIEVFNAQRHDEGIAEFAKLKNCDLIIIEHIKAREISQLGTIEVPLVLLKS